MNNQKIFLTADWKNLALFNFAVPDEVLKPYLPKDCTLDYWQGSAYLSFVAFQFLNTRVLNIQWPGFTHFPEINLRFYIKHQERRGVCFIREFVPSKIVAQIARSLYHEPYLAVPMQSCIIENDQELVVKYEVCKNKKNNSVKVIANRMSQSCSSDSEAHFFKEHDLGVGKDPKGNTYKYEVHHPIWETHKVKSYEMDIDWNSLYGEPFGFLKNRKPNSIFLAKGSEIKVFGGNK